MITQTQCRMARVALDLGVRDLARIADVSPNTVARLERGDTLHPRTLAYIRGALEAEGVAFINNSAVSAWGGEGVRLNGDGPKSAMAKLFEAIWELPDFRDQPEAAYIALIDVLDRYLNIIDDEGRQPDAWERLDLNDALNALNRSNVFLAASYLRHGITPPDNQSPDYPMSNDAIESTAGLDLAYFRRCSEALRTRGYMGTAS
jgi:transcriptional regulator with XRE-family HTH domain